MKTTRFFNYFLNPSFWQGKRLVRRLVLPGSILGLGSYVVYRQEQDYVVDEFPSSLPATVYRVLPLSQLSRLMGVIARFEMPDWLRGHVLGSYVRWFDVKMSEATETDVRSYRSLSALFSRRLRWQLRPVARESDLVAPCDGLLQTAGRVGSAGELEQVKGVRFTLEGFLGPDFFHRRSEDCDVKQLYYAVIYLSPSDCHRFHSPVDWTCVWRRYFPGPLMSVSPMMAALLPGLFSVNERVVYGGRWRWGHFAFAAVGATGVGNISVQHDDELPSNQDHQSGVHQYTPGRGLPMPQPSHYWPERWDRSFSPAASFSRGQLFGMFELGSTLVLVFEAPSDFRFSVSPGSLVKMGAALGHSSHSSDSHRPSRGPSQTAALR